MIHPRLTSLNFDITNTPHTHLTTDPAITIYSKMENKFEVEVVIKQLNLLLKGYDKHNELAFEELCMVLDEFTVVFKQLNSFLGIAFSDVKDKVTIIQNNNKLFPGHSGFFSFIKMEMEKNIHIYNGDNNKDRKAPKEFKKYNSTARNLLRMMWLLTFIRVTFEGMRDSKKDMSDILCKAYDKAFGDVHNFMIRGGAKLAIKATSDRK